VRMSALNEDESENSERKGNHTYLRCVVALATTASTATPASTPASTPMPTSTPKPTRRGAARTKVDRGHLQEEEEKRSWEEVGGGCCLRAKTVRTSDGERRRKVGRSEALMLENRE
jgi:hypothetical protein